MFFRNLTKLFVMSLFLMNTPMLLCMNNDKKASGVSYYLVDTESFLSSLSKQIAKNNQNKRPHSNLPENEIKDPQKSTVINEIKGPQESNVIEANYDILPVELILLIMQRYLIPNIDTANKLLETLQMLTVVAQIDHKHKTITESADIQRSLLHAIPSDKILLEVFQTLKKKKYRSSTTEKEESGVSKFFKLALQSVKQDTENLTSGINLIPRAIKPRQIIIEKMLKNGVNPNFFIDDYTLLHRALKDNNVALANRLMQLGADVTIATKQGTHTALSLAKIHCPSFKLEN